MLDFKGAVTARPLTKVGRPPQIDTAARPKEALLFLREKMKIQKDLGAAGGNSQHLISDLACLQVAAFAS